MRHKFKKLKGEYVEKKELEDEKLKSLARLEGWDRANKRIIKQKEEFEKSLLSKEGIGKFIFRFHAQKDYPCVKCKNPIRKETEENCLCLGITEWCSDLAEALSGKVKVEGVEEKIKEILGGHIHHRYCDEDSWYSCPKAEDGCSDDSQGDKCNCGRDKQIEEITQALTKP